MHDGQLVWWAGEEGELHLLDDQKPTVHFRFRIQWDFLVITKSVDLESDQTFEL